MIEFTIDGQRAEAEKGTILLEAARERGIDIPALCYHPAVEAYASCRLCLVEVTDQRGRTRVVTSCTYPIREEITVETNTERIRRLRRLVLELLVAEAPGSEEVRRLAAEYGVPEGRLPSKDEGEKCILCGLCERVCRETVGVAGISFAHRGAERKVTTPFDEPPDVCLGCGACVYVCPTGAALERRGDLAHVIEPWGIEVELEKCKVCGRRFAPKPALDRVVEKLGWEPEYLRVCHECRQAVSVKAQSKVRRRGVAG